MKKKINYFVFILIMMVLTGCKEKQNYSYYMQNPQSLKQAVSLCQAGNDKTFNESQCDIVMSAAANMLLLIRQQQASPEEFGQLVLDQQNYYSVLNIAMLNAQTIVEQLKKNSAENSKILSAQDDLYKARKALEQQKQQIKTSLAVLGLSSPE